MERYVLITVDYEIFGNGTGDVRQHIFEPTERMARICEQHSVPLVIFFEVEEYLAFNCYRDVLIQQLGYDPAELIRNQIKDLSQRGHDIQLHLHPEWYQAQLPSPSSVLRPPSSALRPPISHLPTPISRNPTPTPISHLPSSVSQPWLLTPSTPTVDSLFDTQEATNRYIAERKGVIEELSGKPVRAYRAGAFSAQPGKKLLTALTANHICIDSSVVHGLWRKNTNDNLDFRNAPKNRRAWRVKEDVAVENQEGSVWEIPIHSVMGRRWQQLTWQRLRAKFSNNVPKSQQRAMVTKLGAKKSPLSLFKFLFQIFPIKLDFHNLSALAMLRMIKAVPAPAFDDPLDVLVMIGHSKEHIDDRPLDNFLRQATRDPNLKFVSFTQIAQLLAAHS
jgi:hypothetical protein